MGYGLVGRRYERGLFREGAATCLGAESGALRLGKGELRPEAGPLRAWTLDGPARERYLLLPDGEVDHIVRLRRRDELPPTHARTVRRKCSLSLEGEPEYV